MPQRRRPQTPTSTLSAVPPLRVRRTIRREAAAKSWLGARHYIYLNKPNAVLEAFRGVVEAARAGRQQ